MKRAFIFLALIVGCSGAVETDVEGAGGGCDASDLVNVAGDCARSACVVGSVSTVQIEDPMDDENPCTIDRCDGFTTVHKPAEAGADCGDGLTCDGLGNCQ